MKRSDAEKVLALNGINKIRNVLDGLEVLLREYDGPPPLDDVKTLSEYCSDLTVRMSRVEAYTKAERDILMQNYKARLTRNNNPESVTEAVDGKLPRYGISWNGPSKPIPTPMEDGYWTPWHLANRIIQEHHSAAPDINVGVLKEYDRRDRQNAVYNTAFAKAIEEGATVEQAHDYAQSTCMKNV